MIGCSRSLNSKETIRRTWGRGMARRKRWCDAVKFWVIFWIFLRLKNLPCMTTGGHSPPRSSSKLLLSLLVSTNDTQSIPFFLHKSVWGPTDSDNTHMWLRWLFTQSCWFLSSSSTTTSAAEQHVLKRQEREEESSRVAVLFLDWHHTRDDKWGSRCSPRWLFFIMFFYFILY